MQNSLNLRIAPSVYIYLALLLLVLPVRWLCAAVCSVILHEAFHLCAILLLRNKVYMVQVEPTGIKMRTEPLSAFREFLCALAGPASCLLPLLFAKWFPRLAVCSAFHSLYNLLPVYPLDGGRAMRCMAERLLPILWADRICRFLEIFCVIAICATAVYGSVILRLGILPILAAAALILRAYSRNIPCKDSNLRVQ